MAEKKDSVSITAETGLSLLERAAKIKEYTPENRDEIYKVLDLLSQQASRLDGVAGKMQMTQRKIFSLQKEAEGVSVQIDPERAAKQILEIGKLHKELQAYAAERDELRAEYKRVKALADDYNMPTVPEQKTFRMDGGENIRRAFV